MPINQTSKDFYVKRNDIVLGASYDLSVWCLRIWHYFLFDSVNRFTDRTHTHIGLTHEQFMQYMMGNVRGDNIHHINRAISILKDTTIHKGRSAENIKLFDTISFGKTSQDMQRFALSAKFSEQIIPYILPTKNFTRCSIHATLLFKSTYSIRLNEIIQAYLGLNSKTVGGVRKVHSHVVLYTELIRELLCLQGKYRDVYSLKKKVIHAAKDEFDSMYDRKILPYSFDILPSHSPYIVNIRCKGSLENGISITDEDKYAQVIQFSEHKKVKNS